MTNLNTKATSVLMSMDGNIKKSSHYVLPSWALQDIGWICYITVGETSHYILLKDLSRLISKQNNHNNKNISDNIVYMTKPVKSYWKKHLERCKLQGAQRIKLPEVDDKKEHSKVKPTKTEYQLRLPIVIYANFKSVLRKQDLC